MVSQTMLMSSFSSSTRKVHSSTYPERVTEQSQRKISTSIPSTISMIQMNLTRVRCFPIVILWAEQSLNLSTNPYSKARSQVNSTPLWTTADPSSPNATHHICKNRSTKLSKRGMRPKLTIRHICLSIDGISRGLRDRANSTKSWSSRET